MTWNDRGRGDDRCKGYSTRLRSGNGGYCTRGNEGRGRCQVICNDRGRGDDKWEGYSARLNSGRGNGGYCTRGNDRCRACGGRCRMNVGGGGGG